MYLFYSFLFSIGIIALLPRFLFDAARHGKYAAGWRERLGDITPLVQTRDESRPVIWLHCVSVGETQAARPLVAALRERHPHHRLVISTVTLTGQNLAREIFKNDAEQIFYFPFDFAFSVRRALDAIKPSVVLIMETEIWFRFLSECRKREIPVALVNGRLSEKSFRNYRKLGTIIARVLNNLSLAAMQNESDAARIAALGLEQTRIKISGNIKFDMNDATSENARLTNELGSRFQLDGSRPKVLAASTHANEENILLSVFRRLRAETFDAPHSPRLIIAPRHPERFNEVAEAINAAGFAWARRSSQSNVADKRADVILLDSIGELRALYPFADVVFVGGSLVPTGGHNILEPASASKAIIVGAYMFNFAAITKEFLARHALIQLPRLSDDEIISTFTRTLLDLLNDAERRTQLGARARATLDENRGATARTIEMLAPLIEKLQVPSPKSQV